MKYDSLRKTKRDKAIRAYKEAHPELSLQEIGEVFRLSRQRIFQIVKEGTWKD